MAAVLVRYVVGFDRTVSPKAFAQTARWPTTPDRPGLPHGHYFRAAKRHTLADAAKKLGCGSGMTGHGTNWWTEFISTLRMFGYDNVLSIGTRRVCSRRKR